MSSQTPRTDNNRRSAVVTGAIAAVCWGVILPLDFYRFEGIPGDPIGIIKYIMFMLALMGLLGGAVLGGIVGVVAGDIGRLTHRPTVVQPLVGALIGAGIVLLACGNGNAAWTLPLPLRLLGGVLPGLLGGIACTRHRRTPPAPAAQV